MLLPDKELEIKYLKQIFKPLIFSQHPTLEQLNAMEGVLVRYDDSICLEEDWKELIDWDWKPPKLREANPAAKSDIQRLNELLREAISPDKGEMKTK